ncbi:hypothetical protein MNBD_GAMMA26-1453 [hydrothermal vent metagenome]|uniref:Uncharacterized protein n=1 Tax=hydrothermal vent metagenome TaxID=652676 RepID=A0A3B1BDA7_9ZZZZ
MTKKQAQNDEKQGQMVRLRYEQTDASFASQFVVNANQEEVILNISSGYINDPQSGDTLLPIQSRIAMSTGGAVRLINTLSKALQEMQEARDKSGGTLEAGLPKLKN